MGEQRRTVDEFAALGITVREYPTHTVYSGSEDALIGAGLASAEQFPTVTVGEGKWMKSGGYKGSSRNPGQRWKIRRRGCGLFELRRWHEQRAHVVLNLNDSGFQRFMRTVLATTERGC